ncbi:MAG: hypothetical protein QM750_12330 [Rubrivivax sp.]
MDVQPGRRLTIGRWRVDAAADEIEADGRVVKLEPQQMRLLLLLAQRRAVARHRLAAHLRRLRLGGALPPTAARRR